LALSRRIDVLSPYRANPDRMRNANGIVISIIFHVRKGEKKDATSETTVVETLYRLRYRSSEASRLLRTESRSLGNRARTPMYARLDDGDPSRILVRSDISTRARAHLFSLSLIHVRTYVRTYVCWRGERAERHIGSHQHLLPLRDRSPRFVLLFLSPIWLRHVSNGWYKGSILSSRSSICSCAFLFGSRTRSARSYSRGAF